MGMMLGSFFTSEFLKTLADLMNTNRRIRNDRSKKDKHWEPYVSTFEVKHFLGMIALGRFSVAHSLGTLWLLSSKRSAEFSKMKKCLVNIRKDARYGNAIGKNRFSVLMNCCSRDEDSMKVYLFVHYLFLHLFLYFLFIYSFIYFSLF